MAPGLWAAKHRQRTTMPLWVPASYILCCAKEAKADLDLFSDLPAPRAILLPLRGRMLKTTPDPALAPHQPGYHPSPHPCRNRSDPFAPQDSPWPEPSPLAPCCFNHSEIFSLTALSRGTRPPPAPHLLQAGFSSVPFSQPHSASRYLPSPLLTSRSSPSPPLHCQTRGLPRCFCTAVPHSQDQGLPSCCWGDATQSTKSTEIAMTGIESHVDRRHS